ncbi:uncharacterized protein LOC101849132 [Aplysia californica]|uniref:Uncharacterized protein LOC101849132 n=1 Tax=Aplysia californica TaxID=6500 RepID=A0ABM1A0R9_APLCA|nr:uncharacterized protein LOC101849132 [Aplysia californica]
MTSSEESVKPAMDKTDSPAHSVDYYYLEAMRYLSCSEHHSDDSDNECTCRRCHGDDKDHSNSSSNDTTMVSNEDSGGRERSWSHSMVDDYEVGTIGQLPSLKDKAVSGRLKTRRFSDGMLLKCDLKMANGHVHWADDSKKELVRCRPRKKYVRNPMLKTHPVKSILKNSSEESLYCQYEEDGSSSEDGESGEPPA